MGNRYGPRADEFAWTLGNRRRLARYLDKRGAGLSYAEAALLLGTTRGSVAAEASKQRIERLTPEELLERQQRKGYESAVHGKREPWNKGADERRFIEPWAEFTKRKQAERKAAADAQTSST